MRSPQGVYCQSWHYESLTHRVPRRSVPLSYLMTTLLHPKAVGRLARSSSRFAKKRANLPGDSRANLARDATRGDAMRPTECSPPRVENETPMGNSRPTTTKIARKIALNKNHVVARYRDHRRRPSRRSCLQNDTTDSSSKGASLDRASSVDRA